MSKVAVALCVVLIGGCAYIDQNLRVAPQVQVQPANVGHGNTVALRVIDDRQEQLIGRRGPVSTGYGGVLPGAKITTDQDLVEVIRHAVIDGMRAKGFEPVNANEAPRSVKVELRTLSYETASGLLRGANLGQAILKLVASQPSGKTYERTYRSQQEIRTFFIASAETNAKVVNDALTDALQQMFADAALWRFLAEE